jgi:flagellar hook protein FlgE
MVGDQKNGYYSLHIVDVTFEDEGFYQCQFSNQDIQMRSRYAIVSVFNEVKVVKSRKISFSDGEIRMSERYVASAGNDWHLSQMGWKIIGILGILSLI